MNIPALRFPEFKGEWEKKKLGEVVEKIDSGWSPQCEEYPSNINEWGVLKTTSVVWEGFNEHENKKLPKKLEPKKEIEVKPNDILITRAGPRNRVGVTVHVNKVRNNLMLSDKIIRLKTKPNYSSSYISIGLANYKSQQQLFSKSSGLATSQTNISQDIILSVSLLIPTLPEQTKIASFLTAVDEKLQALKKKKSLLEAYKKGVMQKLFSNGRDARPCVFTDEDGKAFPDWEVKKLGEVGTFFSGGTPLTTKRKYFDGKIPFIRSGEINSNSTVQFISDDGLKNSSSKMVEVGDLLYALYGATSGEVGISKINGAINQAILCIRTNLDNRFLHNYLLMEKENIIKTYLQGGQGNLSADIIKSLQIPIPCLEEQTLIANFLSSIDQKINHTQAQIQQTQGWKKGLLQRMFV